MATCPVCGRQYGDDVTACPTDGTPLEADGAVAEHENEPETVVRPRSAQPLPSPRFTEIKLERQAPQPAGGPVSLPRRPEVVAVPPRERSLWPAVAAIAILIVGGLAAFFFYMQAQQTEFAREVSAQISEARVTVADARARLESLPPTSPLRGKLLSLQQWDRDLQNMELSRERTADMSARAREVTAQARSIAEEARVAGAVVPATPPQVPPATPQTAAPVAGQPTEPAADPMKGSTEPPPATQPETKPAEHPASPPATNTAPAPPPPGTTTAPAPGATPPPATKPGSETKKPPTPSDEPPPPPPPNGRP